MTEFRTVDECLIKAIIDETLSEDKYNAYGEVAEKEEYYQIAYFFREFARNEREHAERFRKILKGKTIYTPGFEANYPFSDRTVQNLLFSYDLEEDTINEYKKFELVAKDAGDSVAAEAFREIGEVEEFHAKTFKRFRENIREGIVYQRDKIEAWHCRNCGYIHYGYGAPRPTCPACKETYKYYELLAINY